MKYLISQAAAKLNVARQSIYNKLDSPELQSFLHDGEKGKLIDEEGLQVLAELIRPKNDSKKDSQQTATEIDINSLIRSKDEHIESLKSQIADYRTQLQQKDEQIETISRLVENTQILMKREQDKVLQLESEEQKKKRSFLSRLFKK